jgi:PAS domain S-box-containing protein
MQISIGSQDLDRVVPFGIFLDNDLRVVRVGSSFERLGVFSEGQLLWDLFDAVRPKSLTDADSLRRQAGTLILISLKKTKTQFRFQAVSLIEPAGVFLVGTPVVNSTMELEALGISSSDFAPTDQTPDLLFLRQGQDKSLVDLKLMNQELQDTAAELRISNRQMVRAEFRYRKLVEAQPLAMYIDRLGPAAAAEFVSPQTVEMFGYPIDRWLNESAFFFEMTHPDDRQRVWRAHVAADRDDLPFDEEFRVITADGRTKWVRTVDSVIEADEGERRRLGFMLDITKAKLDEQKIVDSGTRMTSLLENMRYGVLVENSVRSVVLANEALCGMFRSEIDHQELIDLPVSAAISRLIPPADDPAAFLRRTEEFVSRRWPAVGQVLNLSDGRVLEFDFQVIVDDGAPVGAIWLFEDVTERVRDRDTLARARDLALAASDAKGQFLATMSHEIRTPMHGIIAQIDLLRGTPLDRDQREGIDVISQSSEALVSIINDILDYEKVEAGRIELNIGPTDVREVVNGVRTLLSAQAAVKGLSINATLDPLMPQLVLGDGSRLRQILLNLANNAVKFTSVGSVDLEVRFDRDSGGGEVVAFEVRDTGQGIPRDRVGSIFDPFVQAKAGQDGTGLGLAIAHRLVSLMGGSLSVSSVVGQGSRFRFAIPMPTASENGDAGVRSTATEPAPLADAALIVDDSEASRALLGRQVARLGVPHRAVASGAEALDALSRRVRYTSVLLDLDMPEMDGFQVAAAIRESTDPRVARIPIIALANQVDQDLASRCRAAHMDGLLTKPVDLSELRDQFDRLLVGRT